MTDLNQRMTALVDRGLALAKAADEGADWVADAKGNSVAVKQQEKSLLDTLLKVENASTRLAKAAGRRMCVGVFGPSQAGKSYLVNSFGKGAESTFMVELGGYKLDFLNRINPQNESESTGLVTRFTAAEIAAEEGAPLRIRLLSETDVVKIIVNSFLRDFKLDDQEVDFGPPKADQLRARLDEMKGRGGAQRPGAPGRHAIYDLREYVNGLGKQYAEAEAAHYWREVAELADSLGVEDRARLFSPLWADLEPFTNLYVRLVRDLEKLEFAEEACLGMEALVLPDGAGGWKRNPDSILNVLTLYKLGDDKTEPLPVVVRTPSGGLKTVDLPRSEVTALTAEMQVRLGASSYPFFTHADVLDFPGARSRKAARRFEDGAKDPQGKAEAEGVDPILSATAQFLLRGKVEYLFQRYVAERELTAMLLCIPGSNMEVPVLGELVHSWVEATLGLSPEARAKNANTLFLVLTKFDKEFERAQGQDEASLQARWGNRLSEGFLNLYQRYGWPDNWDEKPFRNSFWLRNPAFENRSVMAYGADGRESGLEPSQKTHIDTMRGYALDNDLVRRHFVDPAKAFDEALRLHDGGVGYLVEELSRVCVPDLKLTQIAGRITEQTTQLTSAFATFHDPEGGDKVAQKTKLAQEIVAGLRSCVGGQRFGELLSTLQLDDAQIRPIYAGVSVLDLDAESGGATGVATGTMLDDDFMDELFGDASAPAPAADKSGTDERAAYDRAGLLADEVVNYWTRHVLSLPGDPKARGRLLLDEEIFRKLAQELVKGFERTGRRARIAEAVRKETQLATTQWDAAAERVGLILRMAVGEFVSLLGAADMAADKRPRATVKGEERIVFTPPPPVADLPVLPERQTINQTYLADWITALKDFVIANAEFRGGGELTDQQNRRLGEILARVTP